MNYMTLVVICILSLTYIVSSNPINESPKGEGSVISDLEPLPISEQTEPDDSENWNKLAEMWKKRGWNNLSGAWGKKNNWNNLSGMWGKRDWNGLSGMWGKRGWNNLSGAWGKRNNWNNLSGMWGKRNNWNNLSGMWGKRNNWNNLSGMWGKRTMDDEPSIPDDNKRTTQWNNLKGVWGKRGDRDWTTTSLWERVPDSDDDYRGPILPDQM